MPLNQISLSKFTFESPGVYGLILLCSIPYALSCSSNKVLFPSYARLNLFVNSIPSSVWILWILKGNVLTGSCKKIIEEYVLCSSNAIKNCMLVNLVLIKFFSESFRFAVQLLHQFELFRRDREPLYMVSVHILDFSASVCLSDDEVFEILIEEILLSRHNWRLTWYLVAVLVAPCKRK